MIVHTRFCQVYSTAGPATERETEPLFQEPNMPAYHRMIEAEADGRLADTAKSPDRLESPERRKGR